MNKWKRQGFYYIAYTEWEDVVGQRRMKKTMNALEYWAIFLLRGNKTLDKLANEIPEWAKKWSLDDSSDR